jgi:hypothetical protein
MHHLSGKGSIAYGTKRIKRTYQTKYSRSAKPIPSPTNPVKIVNGISMGFLIIDIQGMDTSVKLMNFEMELKKLKISKFLENSINFKSQNA